MLAEINAKLAAANASNAQLKLALENAKKRKESSSGEAVIPQRKRKNVQREYSKEAGADISL